MVSCLLRHGKNPRPRMDRRGFLFARGGTVRAGGLVQLDEGAASDFQPRFWHLCAKWEECEAALGGAAAGLATEPKARLFHTYNRATGHLTGNPLPQANAYALISGTRNPPAL